VLVFNMFIVVLINFVNNLNHMVCACSSGTSAGEPKLMPSIAEDLDRRTFVYNLIMPIMNQLIYLQLHNFLILICHDYMHVLYIDNTI